MPEYTAIELVEPEVIYVPVYDPVVIFGVGYWPPANVPFFLVSAVADGRAGLELLARAVGRPCAVCNRPGAAMF